MGPYMPGYEEINSACTLDPSYEFQDINNLNTSIVEEIKMTSYLSDTFSKRFCPTKPLNSCTLDAGHGIFHVFPGTRQAVLLKTGVGKGWKHTDWVRSRHRPWYWQCEQAGKTIITPPYVDATTDELVITVASPVYGKTPSYSP